MTPDLATVYHHGQFYFNHDRIHSVHAEGLGLVEQLQGDTPPDYDTVRRFLELHAEVMGSWAISNYRRWLHGNVGQLVAAELAERLERFLTVTITAYHRALVASTRFLAALGAPA